MMEWADVKAGITQEVTLELKNSAIFHCKSDKNFKTMLPKG